MTGFYYLATPYSKYPGGLEAAHDAACELTARLVDAGWPIFCPIAHSHCVSKYMTHDPRDSIFWINVNRGPLETSSGLIVAMMSGWRESAGIKDEIAFFEQVGRPIIRLDPNGPITPYQLHLGAELGSIQAAGTGGQAIGAP